MKGKDTMWDTSLSVSAAGPHHWWQAQLAAVVKQRPAGVPVARLLLQATGIIWAESRASPQGLLLWIGKENKVCFFVLF